MSDISKNDAVGFANSILAMQKRIAELEQQLLETTAVNVKLNAWLDEIVGPIEALKRYRDGCRDPTSAPRKSAENDQHTCIKCGKTGIASSPSHMCLPCELKEAGGK